MSLTDAFVQRFQFETPAAYRLIAGNAMMVDWPQLPEFHWLTASEVAAFQFESHQWPDFIPFARNRQGDLWCWCPGLAVGAAIPVGFCPLDCDEGEVYAPDFTKALFRLICDAAQHLSSDPGTVSTARALLNSAAECPLPLWIPEWRVWFRETANSPLAQWRTSCGTAIGIPSREQYERAISEWIDDGEVGSVFRWMNTP